MCNNSDNDTFFQAAGGLASGQTALEGAWKESKEEASVPDKLLKKLKPVGSLRWVHMKILF